MTDDVFTCSLVLPNFSIDFVVNEKISAELSRGRDPSWIDFVYAFSKIRLQIENSRCLLVPERETGNLIELFKIMRKSLCNPTSILGIEKIIACGSWGVWKSEYWTRFMVDKSTAEDEIIYDLLMPLAVVAELKGHIATYRYNGAAIIEAGVRPNKWAKPTCVWTEFSTEKIAEDLLVIQKYIENKILTSPY